MNHIYDHTKKIIAILMVIMLNLSLTVKAQTITDRSSPQFLFPDFTMSNIKMKNGENQSLMLNYNTLTEKMVFERNGTLYDFMNPNTIDTVFLQNSMFVPVGKAIYEVLVTAPISLYIQHKGDLILKGGTSVYGGTSDISGTTSMANLQNSNLKFNLTLPSDYNVLVDHIYWIHKGDEAFSFLNQKQFLNIFPDKEKELKLYIKENRIKMDEPDHLVMLVRYCNELIH